MHPKVSSFLGLLLCAATLLSCEKGGSDPDPVPDDKQPGHTLIIYMMGNNGLASFMDKNVSKIMSVVDRLPEKGRIALFYDRGNYTRLSELVVSEDGRTRQELIKEWNPGKTSSVDPAFMSEVFELVKEKVPSETYGLIMSSHGGGWVPSDLFDLYLAGGRNPGPLAAKPFFFGQDEAACMEIPEMAEVLDRAELNLRYLMFDACFMASVEALYDLRNTADYIVASSAEILGDGFPYTDIIPLITGRNGRDEIEACCKAFMSYYEGRSGTISMIDCAGLKPLAESMKQVLAAAGSGKADVSGIQAYEGFPVHIYFDMEQYAEALTSDARVLDGFRSALGKAVVYAGHTPTFFSAYPDDGTHDLPRSCGLTCHIPQDAAPKTHEEFLKTSWAGAINAE